MTATNINKSTPSGVYVGEVVAAVYQIRHLVALAACHAVHRPSHAFCAGRVLTESGEHRLLVNGAKRMIKARLGEINSLWISL